MMGCPQESFKSCAFQKLHDCIMARCDCLCLSLTSSRYRGEMSSSDLRRWRRFGLRRRSSFVSSARHSCHGYQPAGAMAKSLYWFACRGHIRTLTPRPHPHLGTCAWPAPAQRPHDTSGPIPQAARRPRTPAGVRPQGCGARAGAISAHANTPPHARLWPKLA